MFPLDISVAALLVELCDKVEQPAFPLILMPP